jgi:hypothetical protein
MIHKEHLKAALVAATIGLAVYFLTGCTPQQSASYMPLMG